VQGAKDQEYGYLLMVDTFKSPVGEQIDYLAVEENNPSQGGTSRLYGMAGILKCTIN